MSTLSAAVADRSRKNLAAILQRLASIGQAKAAEALGTSESTVSRMKDKELEQLAKLLAVLGLKVVPVEMRCFDPDAIGAILALAKARLASIERPEQLAWDE